MAHGRRRRNQSGNRRGFILFSLVGIGVVGILLLYTVLTFPQASTSYEHAAGAPLLTSQGKMVVLYIGAEYCPYCAAERWAVVDALSHFGNWSSLQPSLSAPASVEPSLPDIPTYNFVNASYSSSSVAFQSVELNDRLGNPLQQPTAAQKAVFGKYDTSGAIPFISIGGQYYRVGSGVDVTLMSGMTFQQVQAAIASGQGQIYASVHTESMQIQNILNSLLNSGSSQAGMIQNMMAVPEARRA